MINSFNQNFDGIIQAVPFRNFSLLHSGILNVIHLATWQSTILQTKSLCVRNMLNCRKMSKRNARYYSRDYSMSLGFSDHSNTGNTGPIYGFCVLFPCFIQMVNRKMAAYHRETRPFGNGTCFNHLATRPVRFFRRLLNYIRFNH